jgi:hypothetical protein
MDKTKILKDILGNELLLKDYGKCIELSGSLWAFLGCALDRRRITPVKQEE